MQLIHIDAAIPWDCRKASGGDWIADCEPLGLTVQSSRYSELAEDIGDALDLLFRELLRSDELDAFLASHGWTRVMAPLPRDFADAFFDVPFELLVAGAHGSAQRVYQ